MNLQWEHSGFLDVVGSMHRVKSIHNGNLRSYTQSNVLDVLDERSPERSIRVRVRRVDKGLDGVLLQYAPQIGEV